MSKNKHQPPRSDGDELYNVEKIVGKCEKNDKVYYNVKWQGWPEEYNTWEPYDNLKHVKDLIAEFNKTENNRMTIEEPNNKDSSNKIPDNKAIKEKQLKDLSYGHFKYGDEPLKILNVDMINKDNGEFELDCFIEWKTRKSGLKPKNSVLSNSIVKAKCPILLIDFYESKIRALKDNKKPSVGNA